MKLTRLPFVLLGLGLSTSACNVFSPLDKPSGDAQLLSAARACFDQGDFTCASENYQKLSASQAAIAASEEVYLALDQAGATMGLFAQFIGDGANGKALTTMAESMASVAGQTKRMALFNALASIHSYGTVSGRTDLENFTVFLASTALSAEILGEIALAHGGVLHQSDITNASGTLTQTPSTFDSAGFNTAATSADQLYWAFKTSNDALTALSPGGSFSTTSNGFGSISGHHPSDGGAVDTAFRTAITGFGIGR